MSEASQNGTGSWQGTPPGTRGCGSIPELPGVCWEREWGWSSQGHLSWHRVWRNSPKSGMSFGCCSPWLHIWQHIWPGPEGSRGRCPMSWHHPAPPKPGEIGKFGSGRDRKGSTATLPESRLCPRRSAWAEGVKIQRRSGWAAGRGQGTQRDKAQKAFVCVCPCAECAFSLPPGPGRVPCPPHVPRGVTTGVLSPLGTVSPRRGHTPGTALTPSKILLLHKTPQKTTQSRKKNPRCQHHKPLPAPRNNPNPDGHRAPPAPGGTPQSLPRPPGSIPAAPGPHLRPPLCRPDYF